MFCRIQKQLSDLYCCSLLFTVFSFIYFFCFVLFFPTTGPRQTLWGSWDAGIFQVFYSCVIIAHLCNLLINCFNFPFISLKTSQIFSSSDDRDQNKADRNVDPSLSLISWCFHIFLGELKVYFSQTSDGRTAERLRQFWWVLFCFCGVSMMCASLNGVWWILRGSFS